MKTELIFSSVSFFDGAGITLMGCDQILKGGKLILLQRGLTSTGYLG
jgi:hypothetical protein